MLVLSRKRGEAVVIGRDITVTVLEVRGDRVKLGFSGPAEVPIHRAELRVKIQREDSSPEDRRQSPLPQSLAVAIQSLCPTLQEASA
ncbi:MAG: carbon storage regulator CsrA [Thermoguttaceae bacterium]